MEPLGIREVGVVGSGVIGVGVAQHLAQTGHRVVLVDVADSILERARAEMVKNLRFQGLFDKTAPKISPDEVLSRIQFTTSKERLASVEAVIENVTEKWEVKKQVYQELDAVCASTRLFAANTSCIPITRIAGATSRPEKVIGMHFMNPVPLKPVVELIRGKRTSEETIALAHAFLAQLNKKGILVNDSPGFVSNRVLMLTINEAIFLVHEGVSTPRDVDRLFTTCFGHKMGPLETADLIGLDTILHSLEVLFEEFSDSKYRPCPLLRSMVAAGWTGKKSGKGFFDHPNGT